MAKKAVITILGTIGGKIDKITGRFIYNSEIKPSLYYSTTLEEFQNKIKDINMFPILISTYGTKGYSIIPIYTKAAYEIQKEVLKNKGFPEEEINKIFSQGYLIENENDFSQIFSIIDDAIYSYARVIIDITHGFRHFPVLMIIDAIMHNIKNSKKIEKVLFAKEKKKPSLDKGGEYEIINLFDYLDLANLSFIIKNFKENFTISKNIEIRNPIFKELKRTLNEFSWDIMALSIRNCKEKSYPALIEAIENIKNRSEIYLLKRDLQDLEDYIISLFSTFESLPEYESYIYLAKEFNKKNYLLQSITIINEAKLIYLREKIKEISEDVYKYIEEIQAKIEAYGEWEPSGRLNYYELHKEIKDLYFKSIEYRKGKKIDCEKLAKNNYLIQNTEIIKQIIEKIEPRSSFTKYLLSDLRNNLAHANINIKTIENVKHSISSEIATLENFINDDIPRINI